jgi:uncharacterized protein YjgD (DUF1641 family)
MSSTTAGSSATGRLQERLNDPKVAQGLNRLLDQLDTVSFAVESVDGFIRRGEVITDTLSEGVAELKGTESSKAVELLQNAPQMLQTGAKLADAAAEMDIDELAKSKVLERLTDPQTLETLNQLLDKLPLIAFFLESLEGFISRGDTIADNLSAAVGELKLGELNLDISSLLPLLEALPQLKEAGEKLLDSDLMGDGLPKVIDAGVSMVDSGMLDRQVVSTLGDLGKKTVETYNEVSSKPVPPVGGLFATLRATKDPDVQKSVGFFFAFAKAFAKHLK